MLVVALLAAAGCASGESDAASAAPRETGGAPIAPSGADLPPTTGSFDYQLGGTADRDADGAPFDVVVRDATEAPLAGAYSVCYVNGFQTQPGESGDWLAHPELLLRDASGEPVVDPAWPDEFVLDPSSAEQRAGILDRLGPVVRGCADAGFDAVEIDNLDTWTRFDGVDEAGARELASAYVELAHDAGIAIAQKNAAELAGTAREDLGFDFAIAEECAAYDECGAYTSAYGEHVLQIEYGDALDDAGLTFADACALDDRAPLTILRDRELVAPGVPGHRFERC